MDDIRTGTAGGAFPCPGCGGARVFDPGSGALRCPDCGAGEEVPAAEALARIAETEQDMMSAVEPAFTPGAIRPFTVTREQAAEALSKWLGKKLFCPAAVKKSVRADRLSGVYLPVWAFGASARSRYRAKYGVDRAERVLGRDKTVTDWYPTAGTYSAAYSDRFIPAAAKADADLAERLSAQEAESVVDYRPEYLAGFSAEPGEIGLSAAWEAAKAGMEEEMRSLVRSRILEDRGAHHIKDLAVETAFTELSYQALLLPNWLLDLPYGKKDCRFVVDGRTGETSGKAPVCPFRVGIAVLLAAALIAGLWLWLGGA